MTKRSNQKKVYLSDESSDRNIERSIERVLSALRELRIGITTDEFQIQSMIEQALLKNDIPFDKEYRIAPRNRIDFYIENGIGLEVKRGKPNAARVTKQLQRYAAFEEIKAVILVVDKTVNIPIQILGKRCILFGLNQLWGVALS